MFTLLQFVVDVISFSDRDADEETSVSQCEITAELLLYTHKALTTSWEPGIEMAH